MANPTEEDLRVAKEIVEHCAAGYQNSLVVASPTVLTSAIARMRAVEREKADINAVLAELREMFPERDYIRVKAGLTWFGGENLPDTLARITVNSLEWDAPTLSEAMQKVRDWRAGDKE